MKKILKAFGLFLLIFFVNFLSCSFPSFVKTDEEKTVEKDENILISARVSLPASISDEIPVFEKDSPEITAQENTILFDENWQNKNASYETEFDEKVPGLRIDWDEELDRLYFEKAVSILSTEPALEGKPLKILPTARYGLIQFSIRKSYYDNNSIIIALGKEGHYLLRKIVTESSKNIIDIKSESAYLLISQLLLPYNKAGSLSFDNSSKNEILNLSLQLDPLLDTVAITTQAGTLQDKKLSFFTELFQKNLHPEFYEFLKNNLSLSEEALDKKIEELFLKKGSEALPQSSATPAITPTPAEAIVVKVREEPIKDFPQNDNKWVVLEGNNISFNMGNENPFLNFPGETNEASVKRFSDQKPVHRVQLFSYKILKYEVSVELFEKCLVAGVCSHQGGEDKNDNYFHGKKKYPINEITWENSRKFCQFIGGDLPTEAQWEFAARGIKNQLYVWGNTFSKTIIPDVNFNCYKEAYQCKEFSANTGEIGIFADDVSEFGIYDLNGNVSEWVLDYYNPTFYSDKKATEINPVNLDSETNHVIRGGNFITGPLGVESQLSTRFLELEFEEDQTVTFAGHLGFRCASKLER